MSLVMQAARRPLLIASAMFLGLAFKDWLLAICRKLHGLHAFPLCGTALACLFLHVAIMGLPNSVMWALQRPLIESLRAVVARITTILLFVLRIGLLVCADLDEEQSKEMLEGLSPSVRRNVFQQPMINLLPTPLQWLLASTSTTINVEPRHVSNDNPCSPSNASQNSCSNQEGGDDSPTKRSTHEQFIGLIRNMEGVRARTSAKDHILEQILIQKLACTAGFAATAVVQTAKVQADKTIKHGMDKVSELTDGIREVVADPRVQMTAKSAVGGAAVLGATGGATGMVSGSVLGSAVGLVAAPFTFGLSIPIGAACGGGAGACIGSVVAGGAGLIGGGAAGLLMGRGPTSKSLTDDGTTGSTDSIPPIEVDQHNEK